MRYSRRRFVAVVFILLCLIPIASAGIDTAVGTDGVDQPTGENETGSLAFVSYQGSETGRGGGVLLVNQDTNEVLWSHTKYVRYFDVDPLGDGKVMVVAGVPMNQSDQGRPRYATIIDWRNDTVVDRFYVGITTHDVDYMGGGEYAVADLHKQGGSAYVYNRTTDEIVWEWQFRNHYSNNTGGGHGGYTHLNDIDIIDNGSAFLLSPRNFDRVVLVDRDTKEVNWTLGAEDRTEILYEQHNPVLLDQSPPAVLVADSENNRIIEYQKRGEFWEPVWSFQGHARSSQQNLHWPRDADRLPNGNTVIVDTANDRVLEVTPSREIVWQFQHDRLHAPYDIEIVGQGDEPAGPSMTEYEDAFAQPIVPADEGVHSRLTFTFNHGYFLVSWILPVWFTRLHFALLILAAGGSAVWLNLELTDYRREIDVTVIESMNYGSVLKRLQLLVAGMATAAGFMLLLVELFPNPEIPRELYLGSGFLLLIMGIQQVHRTAPHRYGRYLEWPTRVLRVGALGVSALLFHQSIKGGWVVVSDTSIAFAILLILAALDIQVLNVTSEE